VYRKCVRPVSPVLSLQTCAGTAATVFRRKLVDDGDGVFYDDSYKNIADMEWYVRVVKDRYRPGNFMVLCSDRIQHHSVGCPMLSAIRSAELALSTQVAP
jgi:hypothetical protein